MEPIVTPPVRVLLIEDESAEARLFVALLTEGSQQRFAVECAQTLQEGLACLAKGNVDAV